MKARTRITVIIGMAAAGGCSDAFDVQSVEGTYQLVTIEGLGLPYTTPSGLVIEAGEMVLESDGRFVKDLQAPTPSAGFGDFSTWSGSFTLIEPDTIRFQPSAGAFTPAALSEPFDGVVSGNRLTVIDERPVLDENLELVFRK